MPELPEVESLRLSLLPHLVQQTFAQVTVHDSRLREPVDRASLQRHLKGKTIVDLKRRGKYLLIECADKTTLVIHLGMSGHLRLQAKAAPKSPHQHIDFTFDQGMQLRYIDPRRFGLIIVVAANNNLIDDVHFSHLGIEPLTPAFDADYLYQLTRQVQRPIKNFLMDATKIVGIGNIYASESLYLAKIKPQRLAGRLNRQQCQQLVKSIRQVLRQAIAQGGTTLNDFHDAQGKSGYFQVKLKVYGRAQLPCQRCQTPIRSHVMAGRSTYYCRQCQV